MATEIFPAIDQLGKIEANVLPLLDRKEICNFVFDVLNGMNLPYAFIFVLQRDRAILQNIVEELRE